MKKTIILGDTHGRSKWKEIVNTNDFDRLILIGDYFDSWDITAEEQVKNFLDIVEYKKTGGKEVIMLIGNHDHHYFPEIGNTGTSGYQRIGRLLIEPAIDANRKHLQMAYKFDNFLCTHAGVSDIFMDSVFGDGQWTIEEVDFMLNELFRHKPQSFTFNGRDPYGDDKYQTPIWIRPRSLKGNSYLIRSKGITQIVGHTTQDFISEKDRGYYFIDTLGTSGEYLVVEDGKVEVKK